MTSGRVLVTPMHRIRAYLEGPLVPRRQQIERLLREMVAREGLIKRTQQEYAELAQLADALFDEENKVQKTLGHAR